MKKTEGLLGEAIAHHSAGRLEAAEHLYRALLEIDAGDAEVQYHYGLLALEKGSADEGIGHLRQALELAPDTSRYWLGLAQGFLIAEQPESARIVLDRAEGIGLDPASTRELRESIDVALRRIQEQAVQARKAPDDDRNDSDPAANFDAGSVVEQSAWLVTTHDGLRLHVPADIHCRTTSVLLEQGDWLDPGLYFLRRYIQPGMCVLEVGAGYGVYALTMAKQMRGQGNVIAWEPSSAARRLLRSSLRENALERLITVIPEAVSDDAVRSRKETGSAGPEPMPPLDTLLTDSECLNGSKIDLLRLDASCDIAAALEGGKDFFSVQDPLVMFGLNSGELPRPALMKAFAELGMSLYRPIPSLGLLVPLEDGHSDDRGRNRSFFACRDRTAGMLQQADLMV